MKSLLFIMLIIFMTGLSGCIHNTSVPLNQDTYQIVLQLEGSGSLSINDSMITVGPGDTITVIAYGDTSTEFDKWTHGPSITPLHILSDTIISFTAHGDDTLTAWFQVKKHTIHILPSNTSYGQITPNTVKTVSHGGNLTVKAEPLRGCRFQSTKWTNPAGFIITDLSNNSFTIGNINQSCTLTANFKIIPPVSGVVYVDSAANPNSAKNGSSWFDAYTSLALACTLSTAGSTFWVAKGTYTPVDGMVVTPPEGNYKIELQDNDKLFGGFIGNEEAFIDRGDFWKTHKTILSGEVQDPGTADNSTTVLVMRENTETDGITVKYGKRGVSMTRRNCTVRNVIIQNNTDKGINLSAPNSTVSSCFFIGNTGVSSGAAINVGSSGDSVLIENCVFYNNVTSMQGGAGIYCYNSDNLIFAVYNSFINNRVPEGLTSVIVGSPNLHIISSVFYGNRSGEGVGDQRQISSANEVYFCTIEDPDGNAVYNVPVITGGKISSSIITDFRSIGTLAGNDGILYTSDDGLCPSDDANDLVGKADRKSISPFSMPFIDIINKNRLYEDEDIGAYEF